LDVSDITKVLAEEANAIFCQLFLTRAQSIWGGVNFKKKVNKESSNESRKRGWQFKTRTLFSIVSAFLVSEYMTCTSWRTAEEIQ
jgi:hypothetical protein